MISLPFIFSKEKFLIFEIGAKKSNAALLELDEDRNLSLKNKWEANNILGLKKAIGTKPRGAALVVVADASVAWTALIPVVLDRGIRREELRAVELENLLSQAVGKVFNNCREEAGRCLGLEDLDVVLANSRVINFKVDGHSVLNPVGFRSERVEAMMELVLTKRELLDDVKEFLNKDRTFFFTQKERAEVVALEKIGGLPVGLVASGDKTNLFFLERSGSGHTMERRCLNWCPSMFSGAISQKFGVTEEAAASLYDSYREGNMSEHVLKQFEKVVKPIVKSLADELPSSKGTFFLEECIDMPVGLPAKVARRNLEKVPFEGLVRKYGLSVGEGIDFGLLASFVEFYYDKSDSTINHWLRRHLNWLGSPSLVS